MTYRGERAYPGRAQRRQAAVQPVSARVFKICAAVAVISVLVTTLAVSYSRLVTSRREVIASMRSNTLLAENVELYNAEIERMTAPDLIAERAREMGLVKRSSVYSITVPGRG